MTEPSSGHGGGSRLLPLTLTALGVVYGDIGTSPLYALRECFFGPHGFAPTHDNVLGVLSLIIYALLLVISIRYIVLEMRADNQGEGGILALLALLPKGSKPVLALLGIFGAALLYGDGIITPAITVLGGVEGLEVIAPTLEPYVVPVSAVIIFLIFFFQKFGTHRVGVLFGPIMVVWFTTLAVLGVSWIVRAPEVLQAIDPRWALGFFRDNGLAGFIVLGAVTLVITGGEALYADMGHFGKRPIRLAWFSLVLPALLINYFGQGALLIERGAEADQPFFMLAPSWALIPLVILATAAACIASQALISGAFSLTRQAILLGYMPRLDIEHTSSHEMGQVYVPQVNWGLMIATLLIVIGFGSSTSLAAAYGIAVTMTMMITSTLLFVVASKRWGWSVPFAGAVIGFFLAIDIAFFSANSLKLVQGGWLPLLIAALLFTGMTTWKTGRRLVAERLTARAVPISDFIESVKQMNPARVPGAAVFMTAQPTGTPPALAHNLRYNKVLHEYVVILSVSVVPKPYVEEEDRLEVEPLGYQLFKVKLQYGFTEDPDIPAALLKARELGMRFDPNDLTYFLGRETIIVTRRKGMAIWREHLFVLMARNAVRATAFFRLPPERVVELGVQVEM